VFRELPSFGNIWIQQRYHQGRRELTPPLIVRAFLEDGLLLSLYTIYRPGFAVPPMKRLQNVLYAKHEKLK